MGWWKKEDKLYLNDLDSKMDRGINEQVIIDHINTINIPCCALVNQIGDLVSGVVMSKIIADWEGNR